MSLESSVRGERKLFDDKNYEMDDAVNYLKSKGWIHHGDSRMFQYITMKKDNKIAILFYTMVMGK